jgi:enoyl-CoA hydratase
MSDHPLVRVELVDDAIGLLTLADPDHRNALSLEMTRDLATAVAHVLDLGVGAVVLTAEPPVFCAGGSLDELLTPRAPLAEMYVGFRALANAPVVTIAAVGGAAIGAGVNLPLACDVILASTEARFDPRFLDIGIHPGGGHLWRLEQRVGRQAAAALSLCGEMLSGDEAERKGLAWRCVRADELLDTALGLARRVVSRPRAVVERAKATLDASLAVDNSADALALELDAQQWSMEQPEFHERVRAMQARLDRSKD